MHTFSLPWKMVRYLRCTRVGQNGRHHRCHRGSRLLIPRNYRILEKASNEGAGSAKGIRVVRGGGGGQKSRVNPCKSKLSPASSCTAPRIISFSLRIQLISAPRSPRKRFRIWPCRSCSYLFRFIIHVARWRHFATSFISSEFSTIFHQAPNRW